jgi:hypothetical protein
MLMQKKSKGKMHHCNVDTSERLQKLLMHLSDGLEHSTFDCMVATKSPNVSTNICELRKNDIPIITKLVAKSRYTYQLADVGAKINTRA